MGSGVFRWRECECDPGQGDVNVSHERGSRTLLMGMSPDAADRREGLPLSNRRVTGSKMRSEFAAGIRPTVHHIPVGGCVPTDARTH